MNFYCVTFLKDGVKVCFTTQAGDSMEEAETDATYKLIAKFPNVEFNEVKTILISERQ